MSVKAGERCLSPVFCRENKSTDLTWERSLFPITDLIVSAVLTWGKRHSAWKGDDGGGIFLLRIFFFCFTFVFQLQLKKEV